MLKKTGASLTPSGQIELSARPFAGKRGTFNLRPSEQGACRGATTRPWWTRSPVVIPVWSFVTLHAMSGQTMATHHKPVKVLHRLVAPFRSNPFLQSSASPCRIGLATCFSPAPSLSEFEPKLAAEDSHRPAMLELPTAHRRPFAHHWLELESLVGKMTVGFGPATLPFIDAGEVSFEDRYRNVKWISGMHPLPLLALPPINYRYARAPGEGRIIGKPIPLTMAQSEALAQKLQHLKFVGPYIPIFHDCRTFACAVQASAQGRSALPCYLLFKGYW